MADNAWYYARPALASGYLLEFDRRGARALTIFAERGSGKTAFLHNELAPIAEKHGRMPVYVDVWTVRSDPATGIADALKLAAQKPHIAKTGKRELSGVNVSVLGVSAGVNATHRAEPEEPTNPLSRIGFWNARLVALAGDRKVMLMLDEVQELAMHKEGVDVASALRASFQTHHDRFEPVFTGSHRDKLLQMFRTSKAPLFQFGDDIQFPRLEKDFSEFIVRKFRQESGVTLDVDQVDRAFDAMGRKPGLLIDVMRQMLRTGNHDLTSALGDAIRQQRQDHERELALAQLGPLDQMVLAVAAHERSLFNKQALAQYAQQLGVEAVSTASVQNAVNRLRDQQLLYQAERGQYRVNDPALAAQLRDTTPQLTSGAAPPTLAPVPALAPAAAPQSSGLDPAPAEAGKIYVGHVLDVTDHEVIQNAGGRLVKHELSNFSAGKYELLKPGNKVQITYSGPLWTVSMPQKQTASRGHRR